MFLEDMIFDKKCKQQKNGVKGNCIYTHLCHVKCTTSMSFLFPLWICVNCVSNKKIRFKTELFILFYITILMTFMTYYMYLIHIKYIHTYVDGSTLLISISLNYPWKFNLKRQLNWIQKLYQISNNSWSLYDLCNLNNVYVAYTIKIVIVNGYS